MRTAPRLLVLASLLLGVAACRPTLAPVMEVVDAETGLDDAELEDAIYAALAAKKWQVIDEDPAGGALAAEVRSGGHAATVLIEWGGGAYSILYSDSTASLRYTGGRIHRRYNHWIRLLDDEIQVMIRVR